MEALRELRQGDISYDGKWFVYVSLPDGRGNYIVEEEIEGVVVLSQSCDIVRSYEERPYIEVAPLVLIKDQQVIGEIQKGARPRYAYIPSAASRMLVGDLDRVMTIDKELASEWSFLQGCMTLMEQRQFAAAIARKRSRFAFPDDLVHLLSPLQKRVKKKHSKESPEGRLLRILKEIRIIASPSWEESEVSLTFYFIAPENTEITVELEQQCDRWIDALEETAIYTSFDVQVLPYSALSAWEYINSIPLDLDYLSE